MDKRCFKRNQAENSLPKDKEGGINKDKPKNIYQERYELHEPRNDMDEKGEQQPK